MGIIQKYLNKIAIENLDIFLKKVKILLHFRQTLIFYESGHNFDIVKEKGILNEYEY
jgi:hypothetical protein